MCGIHGIITSKKRESKADDFLKQGFVAGSLRGMDSSGIASIKAEMKDIVYQKLPIPGSMFIGDNYARRLMGEACNPGMITICHTRSATSGPIGLNEAHPFLIVPADPATSSKEIIGVHNGSLTNWHGKPRAKDYKVDSEWALARIYENDSAAFEDFAGAFVFVWYDTDDDETLNIALNDARPLYIAYTEDGSMLFASEAGMLYWLATRNGIKLDGKVKKLLAGLWYRFNINNLKDYKKDKLPAVKTTPITTTVYNGGYGQQRRPNHVEAVQNLLDTIGGKGIPTPDPNMKLVEGPKRKVGVSAEEVKMAQTAQLMGEEGEFFPGWLDDENDEVYGEWEGVSGTKMDAIIRNAKDLQFRHMADSWMVKVIGMHDDKTTISVICTHPLKETYRIDPLAEELPAVH